MAKDGYLVNGKNNNKSAKILFTKSARKCMGALYLSVTRKCHDIYDPCIGVKTIYLIDVEASLEIFSHVQIRF